MKIDWAIRSPVFIIFGTSSVLAMAVDWFSRGFIRQSNLRYLYQILFILLLSLFVKFVAAHLPKNIWLLAIYGIFVGTINGGISMFAACLILKFTTTLHAIKSFGFGEEVLVLTALSMFGGSSIIGGISFMMLKLNSSVNIFPTPD